MSIIALFLRVSACVCVLVEEERREATQHIWALSPKPTETSGGREGETVL